MAGTRRMHGGKEKYIKNLSENLKGRDHLGGLDVDGG